MTIHEVVREMLDVIEREQIDYLLVGAVATAAWSVPRSTTDADFVLAAQAQDMERLLSRLPPTFRMDPQARMELFTATMRWVLAVEGTEFKVELFILGDDAHHAAEWQRRKRVAISQAGRESWIPTAEDIVVQKLRWARLKDLQDIESILAVQGDDLDFAYIEKWCAEHGTREQFEALRKSIPPGL